MRAVLIAVLTVLSFSGCMSFSPEVSESAVLLERSVKANQETRATMFEALAENMRVMFESQLSYDLTLKTERAKDDQGRVDSAAIKAVVDDHRQKRDKFTKDIAAERDKWLGDPNLKYSIELAQVINEYLSSLNDAHKAVEGAIHKGEALFREISNE